MTYNVSYINPFTGQTVSPSEVGYLSLTINQNTVLQWPINGNDNQDVAANIIEVTATTGNLLLEMPPATQVSTGQAIIIRNIGSNAFTVTDNGGVNTLITIASGVAIYLYLTDNTTVNGTWSNVTFGAGTSSADAASLAGYGLTALGPTLNQSYAFTTYFSNATLDSTARAEFAVWEGGVGTITLPTASSVGANWFVMIRNNGTGILNVTCQGSDTLDGNATTQLQITESFVIVSNGIGGFNSFGYGQSTLFAFTILSLVVTGGTITLTPAQASNIIQEYSGTLTSNQVVILPSTVQLYSVNNLTTGPYGLEFKTTAVGAQTVSVGQNQTLLIICDGTNVYNASSGTNSSFSQITLGNGSVDSPSLNFSGDLTTGFYLPANGELGVVVSGTNEGYWSTAGLSVVNVVTAAGGIGGGTF
jgi:hypothetical protein